MGWYATTNPVTRMMTICMAKVSRTQKPSYQAKAISAGLDPSDSQAVTAAT